MNGINTCAQDLNFVLCPTFNIRAQKMRFFIEGYELDVQDPTFFVDEEQYKELNDNLNEVIEDYVERLLLV